MDKNFIYRLADGRLWYVPSGRFLDGQDLAAGALGSNAAGEPDTFSFSREEDAARIPIIDLVSASGESGEAYLARTLAFYGYRLGSLETFSEDAILERLRALDEKYLSPRTLADLAEGNPVARLLYQQHEIQAEPLRQRLAQIRGVARGADTPEQAQQEEQEG